MIDDHKYSVGRTVVYRHANPGKPGSTFGQFGPERTVGVIREVEFNTHQDHKWDYTIENLMNRETTRVPESDIMFATMNRRKYWQRGDALMHVKFEGEQLDETLKRVLTESALANYLQTTVRDLVRKEESEATARIHGRDLPLEEGDYIRVRGDLRDGMESFHNYYAKVLSVSPSDIGGIESKHDKRGHSPVYKTVKKFRILLENGTEAEVYDPEVKLYYTAQGRKTILNWRAATFLAESFGDEPPYKVEYSYLEDHVFSRDELENLPDEQLTELLAALLYVKGHMGLRDFERRGGKNLENIPREYLIDNILASSRFNMRRNRTMTPEEIEHKRREGYKLRRILKKS